MVKLQFLISLTQLLRFFYVSIGPTSKIEKIKTKEEENDGVLQSKGTHEVEEFNQRNVIVTGPTMIYS